MLKIFTAVQSCIALSSFEKIYSGENYKFSNHFKFIWTILIAAKFENVASKQKENVASYFGHIMFVKSM